jgi:hypothetical protein
MHPSSSYTLFSAIRFQSSLPGHVTQEGHTHKLQGLTSRSPEIISSHRMEKLLKKGHSGIIAQFHAIQVMEPSQQAIHPHMQQVISQYHIVFESPKGLPPSCGEHDHSIPLLLGSQPPNVQPYRHPKQNESENIIQELLAADIIPPSTSPYSSPVVMVLKKEGA